MKSLPAQAETLRPEVVVAQDAVLTLVSALVEDGYEVIGPANRNGAVSFAKIPSGSELALGVRDEHEPGSYRLHPTSAPALFQYGPGPLSFKQFLRSPVLKFFSIERSGRELRISSNGEAAPKPFAFIGVRACDIAGLERLRAPVAEQIFRDGEFRDRSAAMVVVAVDCVEPAASCFCTSMGTGPSADRGFDILLSETRRDRRPEFAVTVGSEIGGKLLERLASRPVEPEDLAALERTRSKARAKVKRKLERAGVRDALLSLVEDGCWSEIAKRCLLCGNCTQVCPTCFCTTVEDSSNLDASVAERFRKTDSCFTSAFSYIHGGSVRQSGAARYRQWVMHKFVYWQDQFDACGCVGCGRCITWCPSGIDLTDELETLRKRAVQYGREE